MFIPLEVKGQELNPDWSEPKLRSPILFKMARKSEVKRALETADNQNTVTDGND